MKEHLTIKQEKKETNPEIHETILNTLSLGDKEIKTLSSEVQKKKPEKRSEAVRIFLASIFSTALALGNVTEALAAKYETSETPPQTSEITVTETQPEQQKEDLEKIAQMLKREQIPEKMAFLQKTFKESKVFQGFIGQIRSECNRRIYGDLTLFHLAQKDPAIYGSAAVAAWRERWVERPIPLQKLSITGFEYIDGFSNEKVRDALNDRYSDAYLRGTLLEIRYVPEKFLVGENAYRVGGTMYLFDSAEMRLFEYSDAYMPEGTMTLDLVMRTIQHEMGHVNSWDYSNVLTSAERISMFFDVTNRFNATDRFRGSTVEKYVQEGHILQKDSPDTAYLLVSEWWADLAREYFQGPEELKNNYPEDYQLAHLWISRMSEKEILQ